ncbi:MAG: cytochrome c oxidase assembly protein, partial [Hyphomonadaceae bacterium]|nr:cytochrome c oxidase assembly protein [Clostridia bacterium]
MRYDDERSCACYFLDCFFTSWTLRPELMLGLFLGFGIYLRGWWRLSRILPERFPFWRILCFAGGLLALFVAICSPLDAFAGFLLQAHMVQHILLTMVAPPLIWLGSPYLPMLRGLPKSWVREGLAPLINWPALKRVIHVCTSLGVVLFLFIMTNIVWHT